MPAHLGVRPFPEGTLPARLRRVLQPLERRAGGGALGPRSGALGSFCRWWPGGGVTQQPEGLQNPEELCLKLSFNADSDAWPGVGLPGRRGCPVPSLAGAPGAGSARPVPAGDPELFCPVPVLGPKLGGGTHQRLAAPPEGSLGLLCSPAALGSVRAGGSESSFCWAGAGPRPATGTSGPGHRVLAAGPPLRLPPSTPFLGAVLWAGQRSAGCAFCLPSGSRPCPR